MDWILDSLGRDLRFALRSLRRDRRFSIPAIATLALGIGASTAVYSAVRVILLEPLPYPEADRLVAIWSSWPERQVSRMSNSGGDFRTYQREARSLEGIAAAGSLIQNLTGGDRPQQVVTGWVSRNFFSVLRIQPALGRAFAPDEPPTSLILGNAIWRRNFGADPRVIGRSVELNGNPFTVVGVLPPGFRLYLAADAGIATDIEVWRSPDEAGAPARWVVHEVGSSTLRLIGRLRPGVTLQEARGEMHALAGRLRERYPDHHAAGFDLVVEPLQAEVVGHVRPALLLLQAAVALVMLLACANVASLVSARSDRRRQELDIRAAVGGGTLTLFRQLMIESALLAVLGGVAGLAVAAVALRAVRAAPLTGIPRLSAVAIHGGSLLFALGITVLAVFLFGTGPAWRASRGWGARSLGLRGGRLRVRSGLVVAEVALALMLLAGSAIVLRSFVNLQRKDPGFAVKGLLTFGINLPGTEYAAPVGTARFLADLRRSLDGRPWVVASGATWPLPLEGQLWAGSYRTATRDGTAAPSLADYRLASPGLVRAMGMHLVEGRDLTDADTLSALVDRNLAMRNWPGGSAIGQWIETDAVPGRLRVVGVVDEVDHPRLRTYSDETIYLPMAAASWTDWEIFVVVRTAGDPVRFVGDARTLLSSLDPRLPMGKVRTLASYRSERLAPNRFASMATGFFALAALLLAGVGLYGVIAYSVHQRQYEIAVRMALGATRGGILGWVVRSGMSLVVAGALLGLAGAVAGAGALSGLVYGIGARDPFTFAAACAFTLGVGLAATWLPARRAAATEPAASLRAA